MKVKVITHFEKEDAECRSDYWDIKLFIDDVLVQQYGDYYHDKGREKLEGFFDAMERFVGEFERDKVIYEEVADR